MTDRIARLLEAVRNARAPICTKKFEIASEVLKENRDATPWMKRVLPLVAFLDKMPIFIPDGHLIVGEGASKPFGIELCYEYGMWSEEQLEEMYAECSSWCYLPEDDYEFCRRYIKDENKVISQTIPSRSAEYIFDNEELAAVLTSGVGGWKDKKTGVTQTLYGNSSMGNFPNVSLAVPLYERVLNEGAVSIINKCCEKLENPDYSDPEILDKLDFWKGIIMVYEAWVRFASRYADLAGEMALKEKDEKRAKELSDIEKICRRVPNAPARTFREAIQSFWFTWIMMGSPTNAGGRFDQFMYPFYKADLEQGRITPDEALELLENMKIKTQAFRSVRGSQTRDGSSGGANWFNFTLGGVDEDGNDATNDITYMMIEASRETMLPNHTISVRIHEGTPDLLLKKSLELVKTGLGMPALVSDKEYIDFFLAHGVPLKDARNYALSGCLDGNIPGKTRIAGGGFVGNMQLLDIFLHNGYSRFGAHMAGIKTGEPWEFETFDQFMEAFYKQHKYLISRLGQINDINLAANRKFNQDPFFSGLMEGCLEDGKELTNRKFEPFDNIIMVSMCGAINVCDALAAIKYFIYDKKKYTMRALIDALDHNWEGYEQMRRDFKKAPKYGNNDDYVDSIVADYYRHFAQDIEACPTPYGNSIAAGISITIHQMEAKRTYASADGRLDLEILSDGSTSPEHGCDTHGPLAVFASAMKIKQSLYNATLLNMKFHPMALKTDDDLMKLASATKTYLLNGGKQVQFNVVDRSILLDAQKHPENHKDLIVRVAGYSAYFTNLTKMIQDEVIERTGFENM